MELNDSTTITIIISGAAVLITFIIKFDDIVNANFKGIFMVLAGLALVIVGIAIINYGVLTYRMATFFELILNDIATGSYECLDDESCVVITPEGRAWHLSNRSLIDAIEAAKAKNPAEPDESMSLPLPVTNSAKYFVVGGGSLLGGLALIWITVLKARRNDRSLDVA